MSVNGKDIGPGRGQLSPEEREAFQKRASALGKKLDEAKAARGGHGQERAPDPDAARRGSAMGQAMRITVELVTGVAVGAGVGWLLDQQLGTKPWLLIVFLILGFAAGLANVVRTARRMQAEAEPLQRQARAVKDAEDDR